MLGRILCVLALLCSLSACTKPKEKALAELEKRGVRAVTSSVHEAIVRGNVDNLELLITAEVPTDSPDDEGTPPLAAAVRAGQVKCAELLLEHSTAAQLDLRDAQGRTALSYTVEKSDTDMASKLLDLGASPEKTTHPSSMAAAALRGGNVDLARKILLKCQHGGSIPSDALLAAIELGDIPTADLALAKGAVANQKTASGEPLLYLASRKRRTDMVDLLLRRGADIPPAKGPQGHILTIPVQLGELALASLLMQAGANPNEADAQGVTPLVHAMQAGQVPMVDLFLRHGGEATPLWHKAVECGNATVAKLFLDHGVDIDLPDHAGNTALINATLARRHDFLKFLLDQGADIKVKGAEGQGALHLALAIDDEVGAQILLEAGADANEPFEPPQETFTARLDNEFFKKWYAKDSRLTPLMLAAARGELPMLRLLLKHGAKRGSQTKSWKRYAINFACELANIKAAQLLLGQDPESGRDVKVLISLSKQRAYLYKNGKTVRSTSISSGRAGFRTPSGKFVISDKQEDWTSSIYDAEMPFFMRLSCRDFGLHQGVVTGSPASHGCIRLPRSEARAFFAILEIGDPVTIE